jgi:hypothetical protein
MRLTVRFPVHLNPYKDRYEEMEEQRKTLPKYGLSLSTMDDTVTKSPPGIQCTTTLEIKKDRMAAIKVLCTASVGPQPLRKRLRNCLECTVYCIVRRQVYSVPQP